MAYASSTHRPAVEFSSLLEKVGCSGVTAIEVEHLFEETLRLQRAAQAGQSLRAKKQCTDVIARS